MTEINGAFATINEFGGVDYAKMNAGVTPVFFREPVLDPAESEKAGRAVYRDVERVRIIVAGDPLSQPVSPITREIKERFGAEYERWKAGQEALTVGTPLRQWPPCTPAKVKEFEALEIRSVEDLAGWADFAIGRMPDGREWRDKARAWLSQAAGTADVMRLTAENERMRDEIADLRKALEEMRGRIDASPAPRVAQPQNVKR